MSCSKVAPNPRFKPVEFIMGVVGQIVFAGDEGVVAVAGVKMSE